MSKTEVIKVKKPVNEDLPMEKFDELEEFIDSFPSTEGALIQILHKAQNLFGYLHRDIQLYIARKLDISGAKVSGVVSFYSYFTTKPGGKHVIGCCMGTACFVRGSDKIMEALKEKLNIESNEMTEDGLFTLKDVRCVGACGIAPVVMVDNKVYGKVTVDDLDDIINEYR